MFFGVLVTLIGFVFSVISFIFIAVERLRFGNVGIGGLLDCAFLLSLAVLCAGLGLCYVESYQNGK